MAHDDGTSLVAFEYRYRDAGNFKANGRLLLKGKLSESERGEIIARLEDSEFFIAEQVGIPTLYDGLYAINGGPNDDDHCWHEFVGFCDIGRETGGAQASGNVEDLLSAFRSVEEWNLSLSPHFSIELA
jgi:hypothetical protein